MPFFRMIPVSIVMSIAFATRPNVLFIPNDDLRPMINRWPEPQTLKYKYMMTPNLDKFMDDAILARAASCVLAQPHERPLWSPPGHDARLQPV